jgi:hypothetical protein
VFFQYDSFGISRQLAINYKVNKLIHPKKHLFLKKFFACLF